MKAKKIYWAALCIFIVVIIVLESMGNMGDEMWMLYGIVIALFFVIGINVNRKYLDELAGKLEVLETIRLDDPDTYLAEMEQYYQKEKNAGKVMEAQLMTNIGSGYMAKGDYETAKDKLLTVPEKGLKGEVAQTYYTRLAMTLFHLDKDDAARKLLSLKEDHLTLARQNPKLSVEYHILQVMRYATDGRRKEAREYLTAHPEIIETPGHDADVKLMRRKL